MNDDGTAVADPATEPGEQDGQSVEQMAANGAEPEALFDLIVEEGAQLSLDVGGRKPSTATLSVTGRELNLDGEFNLEEIVTLEIDVKITDVTFKAVEDPKTGFVVGRKRAHKATVDSATLVSRDRG